jgi:glycosyltransferase involved in cell wall biosynthesis
MRLLIGWIELTGYLAACCRELAKHAEVEFRLVATKPGALISNAPFDAHLADGFDAVLLTREQHENPKYICELADDFKPDVIFVGGWHNPAYVRLAFNPKFAKTPFIMGMDNPRRNTLRQKLAPFKIGSYLRRMSRVTVPGERAWQLARNDFKVPENKLRRGFYGYDYDMFAPVLERRLSNPSGWPQRFLFAGRYQPSKGLDILLDAYSDYRIRVNQPWTLECCGQGPLDEKMIGAEGVENLGFVQPGDQPEVMARAGVFVLPSRDDPWPLAVGEHAASGLPLLCSEAAGSTVEILRPYYNGRTVATSDRASLTEAMCWFHHNWDLLPDMGRRSQVMAHPYAATFWAQRWVEMCREVLSE